MHDRADIGHQFLQSCARKPMRTAYVLADARISYNGIRTLVLSFALRLKAAGVGRGDLVAIATDHMPVAVAAHQAIALLGASWVQATREVIDNPDVPITHLLHDTDYNYPMAPHIIVVDQSWSRLPETARNGIEQFDGPAHGDDVWMYAQSSGTTGEPKILPITYDRILKRVAYRKKILEVEGLVIAGGGPALAFPSVNASLMAVLGQGTLVVSHDPATWIREGVTTLFGTPLQHSRRLTEVAPPPQKFRSITIGGAKASPRFLEFIQDYAEDVYISYGSSEAGPICRNRVRPGADFDNLGRPHAFAEVEIVDDKDVPVAAGVEGEVRVRTPTMITEYAFADKDNARAFRHGWFHPGDTGVLDNKGQLRITGRINDQLSISGVKVNAVRVDGVAESIPDVKQAMAFVADLAGTGAYELVVAIRLANNDADAEDVARCIRNVCGVMIGHAVVPSAVIVVDDIPTSARGKPLRRKGPELLVGAVRL